MRNIAEAIVHCTATRPEWWQTRSTSQKVREIKRWHVENNGWSDIGYHFLIDRDGTISEGRPITRDGAHVRGHNRGTIGISLFGGHGSSETDAFEDNYTPAQEKALRALLGDLQRKYGFTKITGHNEYAAKACPGFNVQDWLTGGRQPADYAAETPLQPGTAPTRGKGGLWGGIAALVASGGAAVAAKGCDLMPWLWFCS